MIKLGAGAVVNMPSVQSPNGFKGWPAYAATKGGHQCAYPTDGDRPRPVQG